MKKETYYNIGLIVGCTVGIAGSIFYHTGTPMWLFAVGLALSLPVMRWIVKNRIENDNLQL